jgi:hypothetical protein
MPRLHRGAVPGHCGHDARAVPPSTGIGKRVVKPFPRLDDVLKGAMAAAALPGIPMTAFGAVASEAMWDLAAATPGLVIRGSWWFKPRDLGYVRDGLRRCASLATVEIWCDVPASPARERYRNRRRAALHDDDRQLVVSWPRWAAEAEPLGVAATIMVTTDRQADVADLAGEISSALGRPNVGTLSR